jgi:DNA polymerase-3 subunit gamma/tau
VVDAPGDVLERMRDQASRVGSATLTRYAEVVHAGLGEMRGATAPRLLLEVVCARLLLPSASDTESALLQRVERIETRLSMGTPTDVADPSPDVVGPAANPAKQYVRKAAAAQLAPVAQPTPPAAATLPPPPKVVERLTAKAQAPEPPPAPAVATPQPEPPAPRAPEPPAPKAQPPAQEPAPKPEVPKPAEVPAATAIPDAAAIRRQWTTVMDKVRERSRTMSAMLAGAMVSSVDGSTLVLLHEGANLAKRLGEQQNLDFVQDALRDALGLQLRVRYEVGAPHAAPQAAEDPQAEEESMLAEAAASPDVAPRRDPEEAARAQHHSELGARKIEG